MIFTKMFTVVTMVVILSASLQAHAEPVRQSLVKKVTIRGGRALDARARNELATVAARIKKMRASGTVIVAGHVGSSTTEDYITRSVFLARSVESYLKTVLPAKYQIYIAASQAKEKSSTRTDTASIYLYPFELQALDFRYISSQENFAIAPFTPSSEVKEVKPAVDETAQDYVQPQQLQEDSSLSPPSSSETSSQRQQSEPVENSSLAEEMVNRAKVRAAERAKRVESND